jgi:hypothetical protein
MKVFPRDDGERRLDPRVADATSRRDPLRKGAPDDFRFGLAIHLGAERRQPRLAPCTFIR